MCVLECKGIVIMVVVASARDTQRGRERVEDDVARRSMILFYFLKKEIRESRQTRWDLESLRKR